MTRTLLRVLPFAFAAAIVAAAPVIAPVISPIISAPAFAGGKAPAVSTNDTAYAISGYDPVAYFADGKPEAGDPKFAFEYEGATWLFASAEHLEKFKAAPETYAPQFGGYCAYAVAKGKTAPGDPNLWAIVDDRLYLNFSPSIQQKWDADRSGMIAAGRANWPAALGSDAPSSGSADSR